MVHKLKIIVSKEPDEGLEKAVEEFTKKLKDEQVISIIPFHRQFAGVHYKT